MRQQGWIRAGFARTAMKRAAALSPALAQHLRQRLGPTLSYEFDEAPLLGWMPYEIDVAMAEGVQEELGREGRRGFVIGNTHAVADEPALRPLVQGAFRVFGVTPEAILRMTPQLWKIAYKNVAELSVGAASSSGRTRTVTLVGQRVCPALLESRAALVVVQAQAEFGFRATGATGSVSEPEVDLANASLRLKLSWEAT
jgi:hypothetical protein